MSAARSNTATATTGTAEDRPPRGRFAPTPSGPLHLGSLVAAVGSYLSARQRGGEWVLRVEDLDRHRERPGATDSILRTLEAFGFEWNGSVIFQKDRTEIYASVIDSLREQGLCYACRCSRRLLAGLARDDEGEAIYPGSCLGDPEAASGPHALRFRVGGRRSEIVFEDRLQGTVRQNCARQVGDFVIRRRDGFHAYHLAVVVDDELQGITEVVRGADLLASTPRQLLLQQALAYRAPAYAHLPLVVEPDGSKLAKSRRSIPLDPSRAGALLVEALTLLAQDPPAELAAAAPSEIWSWALANWRPARLVGVRERRLKAMRPGDPGRAAGD